MELGRKACAKADIDSPNLEWEWFVTPEGIAKRRPTELRNLFTEGRSMKRAWIEGHTQRNWLAKETEHSRVAAVIVLGVLIRYFECLKTYGFTSLGLRT